MAYSEQVKSVGSPPHTPLTPLSSPAPLHFPSSPLEVVHSSLQMPGSPLDVPVSSALSVEQRRDIEKEADQLFRGNTVEQIKSLEKEKRLEIDRRREDLRQMVGERYRDLIDAADSIMHMKKCSEHAKQSVATMEQLCQRVQQTHFLRGSGGLRGPAPKTDDQAVAAQVKLLADAPENIWLCLENRNYLPAAHTYLLARHIFSQLSLKLGTGSDRNFAVVQRLWHSVACFKESIIKCSSNHLQCLDLQQEHMLQSLCAIVLLEGCSPRQVFAQALLARKGSIQSVFSGSGPHRSVKSQVCELVKTIVESLAQISNIFCAQQHSQTGSSLLVQRLTQLTKKECTHDLIPASLAGRLPSAITGFTPGISANSLTEIPVKDIHSSTRDWITTCVSDVGSGMKAVLQHITTFKALAGIRESVHSLLSHKPSQIGQEFGDSSGELQLAEAKEEWSRICQNVLGSELCVWDMFLRPLLLQRAQALVDKGVGRTASSASKLLDALLTGASQGRVGGLWEEDFSNSLETRFSPLSLKAKACSPGVFSFCQDFDEGLKDMISDLAYFLGKEETKGYSADSYWMHQMTKVGSYPFSLTEDTVPLQTHVQEAALDSTSKFLKNLGCKVSEIQQQLNSNRQDYQLVNRLVLMGNLCRCLTDCCPHFSFLASGCRHQNTSTSRSIAKPHKKLRKEEQEPTAAEMLREKAFSIFRIWAAWCSDQIVAQLQEQFNAELELNSLATSLAWEEIQISEESESGEKVSSVIQVPAQSSVYVTSLLFTLCQEISRVGGHALDRSLLEELSGNVFQGVVNCYESLLQSCVNLKIPQPCALQLLFNLKFFSKVLVHPSVEKDSEEVEMRLKKLVESLQAFVDPFDLDVFLPYISANLDRQLTRSSVLFGVLLAIKGSSVSSSLYKKPTVSGGQEQHITIPLASSISRLPTLPMTTSATQSSGHILQDMATEDAFSSLFQTLTFFHHL